MSLQKDLEEAERLLEIICQQLQRKRAPRAIRTDIHHAQQLIKGLIEKEKK